MDHKLLAGQKTKNGANGFATKQKNCLPLHKQLKQTKTNNGKLIFSTNGLLVVRGETNYWLVPPTKVLRLLPDVVYEIHKFDHVSVQTVKLPSKHCQNIKDQNLLFKLTPLLRELLENLAASNNIETNTKKLALVDDLLNQSETWQNKSSIRCFGEPKDPRVAHICNYIYDNLSSKKSLQEWAVLFNNDTRTLHRLFVQELGVPFTRWRQQVRCFAALTWLAEGSPVTEVAFDLGYQSQSAFSAMFRRNIGITPSEWQASQVRT